MDVLLREPLAGPEDGHLPAPDPGQAAFLGGDPDGSVPVLRQVGDVLGVEAVGAVEYLGAVGSEPGQAVAGAGPDEAVAVLEQGADLALGQAVPVVEVAHGEGLGLDRKGQQEGRGGQPSAPPPVGGSAA